MTFIVFDGLDGTGKSMHLASQAARLRDEGHEVTTAQEPSRNHYGMAARLLLPRHARMPNVLAELFTRDRAQQVDTLIKPALAVGHVVLVDRYWYSLAYQKADGLRVAARLRQQRAAFPIPVGALLFTASPQVVMERTAARGGPQQPHEQDADYLRRVAAAFQWMAARCPEAVVVDTERPWATVVREVTGWVDRWLDA